MTTVFPTYRIFTDATADLNAALTSGLPTIEVIPMSVEIGGQHFSYGRPGDLTTDAFYRMQRAGKYANTSQINPMVYMQYFEKALQSGYDVLYLCFSSGMSSTTNSARLACDELRQRYPERSIYCIDTLCASVGEGFLVHEAARLQALGMQIGELAQWVLAHRLEVSHWFTVDTFTHLRHGGRVSAATAVVGGVLNIKPLLRVDQEGCLKVVAKPRGLKQAVRSQLQCMEQGWNPDISNLVIIAHGDNPQGAMLLTTIVSERFPGARIVQAEIGPVIGAHTGPGMLAMSFWGRNRSHDFLKEGTLP